MSSAPVRVTLTSLDSEATKQKLAVLPEKMLEFAFEALLKQAELIKALWQIYIHVDTGSARDSVRVERGGEGLHWRRVSVRGGGYVTNPKTGRKVDYMGVIEAKYGAGRTAFDEVYPTIKDMIQMNVVENVSE